jgi:hypothetical protein
MYEQREEILEILPFLVFAEKEGNFMRVSLAMLVTAADGPAEFMLKGTCIQC